jgi:hypothetical protein
VFAQTGGTDPFIDLAQYGILGLVVMGFILGWIWPRPAVDRMIEANEALLARLEKRQQEALAELQKLREALEELARLEALRQRERREQQ